MKKILLVDADSTIPNIALMKLSTFHKNNGDNVELLKIELPYYPGRKKENYFLMDGYDKIYCSVIFENNKQYIRGKDIIFGGTGCDLKTKLPDEIENSDCDYSIYPENDISYGFITRGCIRKCSFCKVPEKEGYIHKVNDPENIIKHKKVKFLDNNILAYDKHEEVLQKLIDLKVKCQFNQGLDIRLINESNSDLLSKLNYLGEYIFAFDDIKYEKIILDKLELLKWRKDWQFKFFVYIHPKMKISDTVKRVESLKNNKCIPYIMRDLSCWESENSDFFVDLAAWCNQVNIFKKMSFDEYIVKRHPDDKTRSTLSGTMYSDNL
jgi:hypothetical protein